jgi:ribosome maturation protein Sdo1
MIEANTDTRFQFIRECIEDGKVEVDHISTADQLADIFTKALGRARFIDLRRALRMVRVQQV